MAQLTFVGMDRREIDGIFPESTRQRFPHVKVTEVADVGSLAKRLVRGEPHVVVYRPDISDIEGDRNRVNDVLLRVDPICGKANTHTSIEYIQSLERDYPRSLQQALERASQ